MIIIPLIYYNPNILSSKTFNKKYEYFNPLCKKSNSKQTLVIKSLNTQKKRKMNARLHVFTQHF